MATVASLMVKLTANTVNFVRNLQKAEDRAKRMNRAFDVIGANLRRGLSVAGLVAVTAGIGSFVNRELEAIDATAKFSDRLGIAIGRMYGLQQAAQLNGASIAQLHNGLESLARRLGTIGRNQKTGELIASNASAKRAVEELGLSFEKLNGQTVDQSFIEIASALEQVDSHTNKAAIAFRLLGRQGQPLLTLFNQGGEAIEGMIRQTELFNGNVTREQAANIEELNDAWLEMTEILEGNARGTLGRFSGTMRDFVVSFSRGSQVLAVGVTGIEMQFNQFLKSIFEFMDTIPLLGSALEWINGIDNDAFAQTFGERAEQLRSIGREQVALMGRMQQGQAVTQANQEAQAELTDQMDQRLEIAKKLTTELRNLKTTEEQRVIQDLRHLNATEAAIQKAIRWQEEIARLRKEKERLGEIESMLGDLRNRAETAGMDSDEVDLYRLKVLGASEAELAHARALQEKVRQMEAAREQQEALTRAQEMMADKAAQIEQDVRTPLEAYRDRVQELKELAEKKLLDPAAFARSMIQAKEALFSALPQLSINPAQGRVQAIERGSIEAIRAVRENRRDPEDDAKRIRKEQLKAAVSSQKTLEKIERKLGDSLLEIEPVEID
ncbi:Hypothetical protein PBC10988_23090 [Planctomycetales bacterium 10988]|nr:Hypothetical protein PBC10988_23090 [Planctomycetales bacterium 10988]